MYVNLQQVCHRNYISDRLLCNLGIFIWDYVLLRCQDQSSSNQSTHPFPVLAYHNRQARNITHDSRSHDITNKLRHQYIYQPYASQITHPTPIFSGFHYLPRVTFPSRSAPTSQVSNKLGRSNKHSYRSMWRFSSFNIQRKAPSAILRIRRRGRLAAGVVSVEIKIATNNHQYQ